MELYLFRHGDAGPAPTGGTDEERQLTDKGRDDTRAAARVLRDAGLMVDGLYTSPLLRARETGEILQQVLGLVARSDERLRPGCRLGAVQDLLSDSSDERVMIVGHEPDMSGIVGELTGGRVKWRTSGFARVQFDRPEPGRGVLLSLVSPETFSST
jgi:phosphohistidine phosphatase